ncbi:hypothetical protein M407DRAFT_21709 [Tulasnella calospora MUT 4182]|uniref:Uncharacterized protein n=1 Tax=Tulasnella calospora MUT 4182 TaxID=1051891 RepID=A0A0C3M665_9AGAM|nr:hypothetical protein M407DRAFT_21709 [Tulasnella calospora MUT 4182]
MKDLAPRTGSLRAPPYMRPSVSAASMPGLLHPGIWKPTTTTIEGAEVVQTPSPLAARPTLAPARAREGER